MPRHPTATITTLTTLAGSPHAQLPGPVAVCSKREEVITASRLLSWTRRAIDEDIMQLINDALKPFAPPLRPNQTFPFACPSGENIAYQHLAQKPIVAQLTFPFPSV
eukprot:scaffold727_cov173-Ochromonas_danica.AAC.11